MVVYDRVLPNEAVESLVALTIGVGIALFFDFLIKSLRSGFVDRAGQRADVVMGRLIFDNLLDMQMRAKKGSTGALASTLREFESLRDFFTSATLVAVVDLPFIFLFLGVIYMIGGSLALVPALCIPIVLLVGIGVQPLLSRLSDFSSKDGQSKQSILVETLSGLETIKAVGAARQMRARWEEAVERQADHGVRSRAISQFALNITAFVQQGAQVMIVFYGVFLIMDGQVSMGALIGSVMLTGRCLAPLAQLVQTLTRLNQARTSFKSLNALMKSESERPIGRSWLSRPRLEGEITFSDVHFSYPDAVDETLKGLSFHIKKGERVAILGKIGCGKSTVARLILGLYEPKAGAVLIDGTDIRQIDPGDIRRNIGSVLQDVWLFSGTIRDNISIGTMRPQDNDILVASKIAGVDTFVSKHPSGYDMILAERGEGLSGGQRQAITLARALIGRPPILLMDEPTSSMDVQNEAEVISRLSAHIGDRTLVIITHRTSLLELVDRVIVIDQGKVVADGPKSILSHPVSPRQVAEK
jgi:ATP-binding cassette subfamily C protein LapB